MIEQKKITSEKTVLIGLITQLQDENRSEEYLDELEFLTTTAGGLALRRFVQRLAQPHPKTFLGTGKLQEVKAFIDKHSLFILFSHQSPQCMVRNQKEEEHFHTVCPKCLHIQKHSSTDGP